jgi:hypothetical protein
MRKLFALLTCTLFVASSAMAATPAVKDWTLLVFLNGDNNLDSYGAVNIQQMEQVGSTANLNIVVQWASEAAGTTKRLLVQKENDTDGTTVSSPIVADIGKTDMGDYKNLIAFIQWGVQNYPAKHYMIDVWDHGSGWHSIEAMSNGTTRHHFHPTDISWDDLSGNNITTEQLGMAIAEAAKIIGHKVDIYGSDACLMAMVEVANEMADSVQYFAGSQETEPGAGWPYGDWLKQWANTPNATPDVITKTLVDAYVKSYQTGGSNATSDSSSEATFSAYDMSKLPALDNAIADLGREIRAMNATDKAKLLGTAKTVQAFADPDYGDLLDFMTLISSSTRGVEPRVVSEVQSAAQAMIISNADTQAYTRAKGMSIWLPTDSSTYSQNSDRYKGLKFNAASDWGATLDFLLQGASR